MKLAFTTRTLVAAALGLAASAQAAVVSIDSVMHGVWGNASVVSQIGAWGSAPTNLGPLNTGVTFNAGDTVTIATTPGDTWRLNGMNVTSHGTINVYGAGNTTRFNQIFPNQTEALQYGSLVYSTDGSIWDYAFNNINDLNDTSISFVATSAGTLRLGMWDSVVNDNGGGDTTLTATITVVPGNTGNTVPLPGTLWLAGLGLMALGVMRRR